MRSGDIIGRMGAKAEAELRGQPGYVGPGARLGMGLLTLGAGLALIVAIYGGIPSLLYWFFSHLSWTP